VSFFKQDGTIRKRNEHRNLMSHYGYCLKKHELPCTPECKMRTLIGVSSSSWFKSKLARNGVDFYSGIWGNSRYPTEILCKDIGGILLLLQYVYYVYKIVICIRLIYRKIKLQINNLTTWKILNFLSSQDVVF
jgi:hypothetical protein